MFSVRASRLHAAISGHNCNQFSKFQILLYSLLVVLSFVTLHTQLSQKRRMSQLRASISLYQKNLLSAGNNYLSNQLTSFEDLHDTLSHEKERLGYRLDEVEVIATDVHRVTSKDDESSNACVHDRRRSRHDHLVEWKCWQQSDACKVDVDGAVLKRNAKRYWFSYKGGRNLGPTDHCKKWSSVSPDFYHNLKDDFCRNPDGRTMPWCYRLSDRTPTVLDCYYNCGYENKHASSIRLGLNHEVRMKLIITGYYVSITAASSRASHGCVLELSHRERIPDYWLYFSYGDGVGRYAKDKLYNRNGWAEGVIDARMTFRNGCLKEVQFDSVKETSFTCFPGCKLQFLTIEGTADVLDFEQMPLAV